MLTSTYQKQPLKITIKLRHPYGWVAHFSDSNEWVPTPFTPLASESMVMGELRDRNPDAVIVRIA